MASGYLPVDTPPGTAPMPLGQPVPAKPATPSVPRNPRAPRLAKASGKGRTQRPPARSRKVRG